ncbi:DEAD/DEAH box helicase family protein [Clostridium butyricum]|uniref:DEAD/DEAH box helicase family protein n=1 Tax=Clostridium butyricum TaxID=1492 RepID=UPI002107DAA1|nr:DEAD/DEAH box helicase family protein [Clostridium butyricum]MCQ2012335.1 DEAD/DEAH box helicase family protein [Clostridium butyricum]MCQ2024702.1 DEAD/DEAH box helicase family protein [Clostridium butyricum]
MKFEKGTKYTNVITDEMIMSWNREGIILNGATGSGKTSFITNNLYMYAEKTNAKILFLCNRTALRKEVMLEKQNNCLNRLSVMTYQALQERLRNNEKVEQYEYVVCDEWHYVLSDALFNLYTDLTYDWITSQKNTTKIFMSGTANDIFTKLKDDGIVKSDFEYEIPYDYSYAKAVFFKERNRVYDIINDILTKTNEKIIYFCNSLKFGIEVCNQFKEDAVFRCGEGNSNLEAQQINDINCINAYNSDLITFDKRILITTKALDNGINIIDSKVKHIISDVFDLESAQQCLGRKRIIDGTDTCTFYIRNYNKGAIGNFKGDFRRKVKPIELLIKDEIEFENKYGEDRNWKSNFIYIRNKEWKYNELAYYKLRCDMDTIELMEAYTYKDVFLATLGDTLTNIEDLDVIDEMQLKDEIWLYLNSIKGVKLFKEQQKELANRINLRDSRNRMQSSIGQLNAYLIKNYNMTLISDNKNSNRKTAWILGDI